MTQMMNRFFAAAGARPGMDAAKSTSLIDKHIATVPLDSELVQGLSELLHGLSAELQRKKGQDAGPLLGQQETKLSQEPPPEGSVSAKHFLRPPGGKIR